MFTVNMSIYHALFFCSSLLSVADSAASLPGDVLKQILSALPVRERGIASGTNQQFHDIHNFIEIDPNILKMEKLLDQITTGIEAVDVDGIIHEITALHLKLHFNEQYLLQRPKNYRKWIRNMESSKMHRYQFEKVYVIEKVNVALGMKPWNVRYHSNVDNYGTWDALSPYTHYFYDTMRDMDQDLRMGTPKLWRKQYLLSMWEQMSESAIGMLPPLDTLFENTDHEGLQTLVRELCLILIHPSHLHQHRKIRTGLEWQQIWKEWDTKSYSKCVDIVEGGEGRYFELRTEARLFTLQLRDCTDDSCQSLLNNERLCSTLDRLYLLPHLKHLVGPLLEAASQALVGSKMRENHKAIIEMSLQVEKDRSEGEEFRWKWKSLYLQDLWENVSENAQLPHLLEAFPIFGLFHRYFLVSQPMYIDSDRKWTEEWTNWTENIPDWSKLEGTLLVPVAQTSGRMLTEVLNAGEFSQITEFWLPSAIHFLASASDRDIVLEQLLIAVIQSKEENEALGMTKEMLITEGAFVADADPENLNLDDIRALIQRIRGTQAMEESEE